MAGASTSQALPMDGMPRAAIVKTARAWIATPYHHQASLRGVGADCLGLLRGVWRDLYGAEPERPPAYSRDWAEAAGREDLLTGAARHMRRVDLQEMQPGDALLFRMRDGGPAKHVGLLTGEATFIHAMEGVAVSEVALTGWWRRRLAAVFVFPGVTD